MDAIQVALDEMMEVDLDEVVANYTGEGKAEAPEAEVSVEEEVAVEVPETVAAVDEVEEETVAEVADAEEEDEEVLVAAFGGTIIEEPSSEPEPEPEPVVEEMPEEKLASAKDFEKMLVDFNYEDGDELYDSTDEERARKKGKNKRRQLVYDEDMGEVVSKRRRKGSRKRNEWDDF
jgi:hypothetical protein